MVISVGRVNSLLDLFWSYAHLLRIESLDVTSLFTSKNYKSTIGYLV